MFSAITNFQNKLQLSPNLIFKLKYATGNPSSIQISKFYRNRDKLNKPILELYYSSAKSLSDLTEIMKNGFKITNWYDDYNKIGILLHNSPKSIIHNYCSSSVLVCHVIADDSNIKRFITEFGHSDYLVTNPDLIYPRYLLDFEIEVNDKFDIDNYLTKQKYPTILTQDVIKIRKY